jgi:hypothetical protein
MSNSCSSLCSRPYKSLLSADTVVSADAGYCSKANIQALA